MSIGRAVAVVGLIVTEAALIVSRPRCSMVGVTEWVSFLELVNTAVFQFEDYVFTARFCLFFVHSLFYE